MTKPSTVCLTCKWAEWERRADGRLHPCGFGMCKWNPPNRPAVGWIAFGGLDRKRNPIKDCKAWEKAP